MLLLFYTLFLFFLVLHVPFYYIFVDSNGADKIASRPEMISPVWFLLYLRVALEQFYRKFAFQYPHHLRDRNLRRNRHDKVNVVILYTHFLNLAPFPLTQHLISSSTSFLISPVKIRNRYFGTQTIWYSHL